MSDKDKFKSKAASVPNWLEDAGTAWNCPRAVCFILAILIGIVFLAVLIYLFVIHPLALLTCLGLLWLLITAGKKSGKIKACCTRLGQLLLIHGPSTRVFDILTRSRADSTIESPSLGAMPEDQEPPLSGIRGILLHRSESLPVLSSNHHQQLQKQDQYQYNQYSQHHHQQQQTPQHQSIAQIKVLSNNLAPRGNVSMTPSSSSASSSSSTTTAAAASSSSHQTPEVTRHHASSSDTTSHPAQQINFSSSLRSSSSSHSKQSTHQLTPLTPALIEETRTRTVSTTQTTTTITI